MKIVYCGYDFLHSCMSGLIEAGHEIVELFTWPADNEYDFTTRVIALAEAVKAPAHLSPITSDDLLRFRQVGVDAIICAAYPYKVPE